MLNSEITPSRVYGRENSTTCDCDDSRSFPGRRAAASGAITGRDQSGGICGEHGPVTCLARAPEIKAQGSAGRGSAANCLSRTARNEPAVSAGRLLDGQGAAA